MRLFLREALKKRGYAVEEAGDAESALDKLAQEAFDLIIMDVKLPGMNGIEATARIKDQDPRVVVIVITAHATTEAAYQALEAGAYDFFTKPVHLKDLDVVVKRGLERRHLLKELETLREGLRSTYEFGHIIGRSGPMQDVLHMVSKVIDTDDTVFLYGESGTGKELLALAIHHHSHRRAKPFVTLNCAAIPEGLLESELFGHERGAFTGAFTRKLWKGPYINEVFQDPWGRNYIVLPKGGLIAPKNTASTETTSTITGGGTTSLTQFYAWVLSAGSNGILETQESDSAIQGDDVGTIFAVVNVGEASATRSQ